MQPRAPRGIGHGMRRPRWLGPYRVLTRLATGGMAEIFRGVRTTADGAQVPVAVKCILPVHTADPEFVDMLSDEARITASLDHPNVARVYEFGEADETYFLAMELVDGVDLRSVVRRCRERGEALPWVHALYVIEQALSGLHAAHELDIVHRDFTPSNILVSVTGDVKLIDFGIAKAEHNRSQTRSGVIKGKVKYMSPEQTEGKRLGRRSDVFSAGVVLYECLVGRPPFLAPEDPLLMEAIREAHPDPVSASHPELPSALDAILARALNKDPAARFQTAEAFAAELRGVRLVAASGFEPSELGALVARAFDAERREREALLSEFDLQVGIDDLTPTGERREYTRLVSAGVFPDADKDDVDALREALDAWLATRRAETGTHETSLSGGADSTGSSTSGDDPAGQTLEMDALSDDTGTGTGAGGGRR